tara:strand:- start:60 stop:374 length:315 start_codon:yes stop_codon:yes gene_type:complete
MSKHLKGSSNHEDPLRTVLDSLVAPVFRDFPDHNENGPSPIQIEKTDGQWDLCAFLEGGQLVCVTPMAIDRERTLLRFELEAGIFLDYVPDRTLVVSGILEGSL